MPPKGKAAARAAAPERNDGEVTRARAALESDIAEHTLLQQQREKRMGAEFVRQPFTTALRLAKLRALRPHEGGNIFNIEVSGIPMRASSIDKRLKETLASRMSVITFVLVTVEPRPEIIASLTAEQVKDFVKLGLAPPSKTDNAGDAVSAAMDEMFETADERLADEEVNKI
jgi:hypothetical protein